jgi:competence protein ComEA
MVPLLILLPGRSSSFDANKISLSNFELRESNIQIDLNRATTNELRTLSGIGPVLAKRIIRHRFLHGAIRNHADILIIKGIGNVLVEKIRPFVCLGEACTE